jgi:hypothetical protein
MVPRLPYPTASSQQAPAQIEGQQRSPDFRRSQHLYEGRDGTALSTAADIPGSYLGVVLPSIHRLHRFHGFHRLHPSDILIRFSKRQFFRILQLGLASHRFDLIPVDPNKLNAIFAFNAQDKVFVGPKQLRRFRPFAGSKTGALILFLSRVAAAQSDLCVVTVILDEELCPFPILQAYVIRIFLYLKNPFPLKQL